MTHAHDEDENELGWVTPNPQIEALKPCPFCGGTFVAQGASRDYISVWCDCGARGPEVKFPENCDPLPPIYECHAAWNRRALREAAAPSEEPRDQTISECALAVFKALSGTPAYTEARILAEKAIRDLRATNGGQDHV